LLAIGLPQLGHLRPPAGAAAAGAAAAGGGSSFAPQYAQNGIFASTVWPHEEQVGAAAAPAALPPAGTGAYTRVAGGALPVGDPIGPTAMAETDSGLPQSMQNLDPGSFCRPQWAHFITFGSPPRR
jgi:hypothetical protein